MIKLFSLKEQQKKEQQEAADGKKKVAPGLLRMQKGARACCLRGPALDSSLDRAGSALAARPSPGGQGAAL